MRVRYDPTRLAVKNTPDPGRRHLSRRVIMRVPGGSISLANRLLSSRPLIGQDEQDRDLRIGITIVLVAGILVAAVLLLNRPACSRSMPLSRRIFPPINFRTRYLSNCYRHTWMGRAMPTTSDGKRTHLICNDSNPISRRLAATARNQRRKDSKRGRMNWLTGCMRTMRTSSRAFWITGLWKA